MLLFILSWWYRKSVSWQVCKQGRAGWAAVRFGVSPALDWLGGLVILLLGRTRDHTQCDEGSIHLAWAQSRTCMQYIVSFLHIISPFSPFLPRCVISYKAFFFFFPLCGWDCNLLKHIHVFKSWVLFSFSQARCREAFLSLTSTCMGDRWLSFTLHNTRCLGRCPAERGWIPKMKAHTCGPRLQSTRRTLRRWKVLSQLGTDCGVLVGRVCWQLEK